MWKKEPVVEFLQQQTATKFQTRRNLAEEEADRMIETKQQRNTETDKIEQHRHCNLSLLGTQQRSRHTQWAVDRSVVVMAGGERFSQSNR